MFVIEAQQSQTVAQAHEPPWDAREHTAGSCYASIVTSPAVISSAVSFFS